MFLVAFKKQSLLAFILLINVLLTNSIVHSHEIRPAIVDLLVDNSGLVTLTIDLNLEALMADIGPGHSDTSESDNAAEYQRLRRLPSAQLQQFFAGFSTRFISGINLTAEHQAIALSIASLHVAERGDIELARSSRITLHAQLPANTASLRWRWHPNFGAAALRFSIPDQQEMAIAVLILLLINGRFNQK